MKQILYILLSIAFISCSSKTNSGGQVAKDSIPVLSTIKANNEIIKTDTLDTFEADTEIEAGEIPADGTYQFDIAFAEHYGNSLGVKVTVKIKGDSIFIIYDGIGELTAEKGEVLDSGKIMKHKSGLWIIGHSISDVDAKEIGGCFEGPAIIDFKNKKYWTC